MSCVSISATCQSNQTTTIDNAWLRNAAKLIEKGKVDAERVKLLSEKIDLLNQRISIKDSIIAVHTVKDTIQVAIINTYKAEKDNLLQQRDIAVAEMKKQNKQYRRQKRKTLFAGVGSAAVTAAVFLIIVK